MYKVLGLNTKSFMCGLKSCKLFSFLIISILLSSVESFPQNYGLDVSRCEKICDSSDVNEYLPQKCAVECPGYKHPSTSGRTDTGRIAELEDKVQQLESGKNSLVVAVALLFLFNLLVIPAVIYRNSLFTFFHPVCCNSDYKKKVAAKKRQIKRSRSSVRNNLDNAPTSRRTLSDGEANKKEHSNLERRRSQSVSGKFSSATAQSPPSTIIANQTAIGMSSLMREEPLTTVSSNPDTSNETSSAPKSRIRHPSESSCAAESTLPLTPGYNCSFGEERGYYNDAMSTSSPGLSTSRTSCSTEPVATLSATDLLRQSKELNDSPSQDSSKLSCDSQPPLTSSTPQSKNNGSSDELSRYSSPDTRSSIRRGRRPSSPDSVINSNNILSNSTVATTLSTFHSNV